METVTTLVRTLGPARLGAIGALAAVLLGILLFAYARVSAPNFAPLFTDLDFDDSGAIVRELEGQNVPYELRLNGSTILVPREEVLRWRMRLAETGLPTGGGVGYEIFDKGDGLGATSFVQNLNHLRALEGELARTIRAIDRVTMARVHLVLPERRLFSQNETEATASIVLKLRGSLGAGQIKAIQHLVASAVKGIDPGRVSVVDDRGQLLASGLGDDDSALSSTLEERTLSLERRLKQQIESIVTSVVGAGNARVEVMAELDTSRITETQDVYDPDGQVVRSTQSREETANTSDGRGADGVTAGNELPNAGAGGGGAGGGSQEATNSTEEVVNYEISKRSTTEIKEAGGIRRLSVAVLVDGIYSKGADDTPLYEPRPQEQLDQISALVRSTIGFDQSRGDQVEVVNLQFAPSSITPGLGEGDGSIIALTKDDYFRIGEIAVLFVIGMILYLFVIRPLMRRVVAPSEEQPMLEGGGQLTIGNAGGEGAEAGSENAALPAPAEEQPAGMDVERLIDSAKLTGTIQEKSIQKVAELVKGNPDEAVTIMRTWLQQSPAGNA